jgi:hypothetical protein
VVRARWNDGDPVESRLSGKRAAEGTLRKLQARGVRAEIVEVRVYRPTRVQFRPVEAP